MDFYLHKILVAFSLTAVAREAKKVMTEGGNILTLTYLGGERVVKNYNVMGVAKASLEASVKYLANDLGQHGIRVNAISAGPIRTLSAKGVGDFNSILREIEERAPLRRTTTQEEVGDTAVFLFSDLARGVTGENIHVDSGVSYPRLNIILNVKGQSLYVEIVLFICYWKERFLTKVLTM